MRMRWCRCGLCQVEMLRREGYRQRGAQEEGGADWLRVTSFSGGNPIDHCGVSAIVALFLSPSLHMSLSSDALWT